MWQLEQIPDAKLLWSDLHQILVKETEATGNVSGPRPARIAKKHEQTN